MAENEDDPYKGLMKMFQSMGASSGRQLGLTLGEVIDPPPNVRIMINGMVLDAKYLWIDEYWIQGHTRTHKGHIVSETQPRSGGGGYAEFASHTHDINNDYTDTETLTDTWKAGDLVFAMPIFGDDKKTVKQYAIFGKAVRLDGAT